ncbi:hypothetical protein [Catellatospora tritici]|uniref:hypothetical protein n=1 Tax=Catellatospora tritici TaxID=2851566 RepID=UPI001C2D4801|nr:hypothetical protein [Catellatospora tritici]MBV1853889.1 hypothetical protein [Catellatospora tritici]
MDARRPSARGRLRDLTARARDLSRAHPRRTGIAAVVALAVAAGAVVLLHQSGPRERPPADAAPVPAAWTRPAVAAADLAARVGVRLVRVAATGDGGLLDLRYQVIDPNLADGLHAPSTPPAIVDEASGLVLHELLMGHEHSGALKAAITYYLILENPGNWVHRGSRVTVLLGDAQVEHVLVE